VAEDIKQQIADGARPLAPMRRLRACVESWPEAETGAYDPRCCRFPKSCSATIYGEDTVAEEDLEPAELSVVEVDPEPQPAEPVDLLTLIKRWGDHMYRMGVYERARDTERARSVSEEGGSLMRQIKAVIRQHTAESGPVVLSLPQVPPGTVALVGDSSGARFLPTGTAWAYDQSPTGVIALGGLLDAERSVTVEFAPPRGPRTWEQLDGLPTDLPKHIELNGRRYRRAGDGSYVDEKTGGMWDWWSLRGRGEVREVLT